MQVSQVWSLFLFMYIYIYYINNKYIYILYIINIYIYYLQFAVQTVGCSIGAMAFPCAAAFLGLNRIVLYKATRNLHTNGLCKRSVLLLVRCLVCGKNFISKVCGHEIAGNNFVSGRMITSGLRLYSKVGLC